LLLRTRSHNSPKLQSKVKPNEFHALDVDVARARIVLSLLAMLTLYVDPTTTGGLFHLTTVALVTLLCHLTYSVSFYFALRTGFAIRNLQTVSIVLDLMFATMIAFLTEGQTSPSYIFFVFAILAVGVRASLKVTIAITLSSVVLYLLVIAFADRLTNQYVMRAVYLAIAGYLIGFFGQQRALFELRIRELETRAERHSIARSLHDGYVQALAGVNLRLETCRELLVRECPGEALRELTELQRGVAREYDEVRVYIRSLAGVEGDVSRETLKDDSDPRLELNANFTGRVSTGEHLLQIMLEGLRNARRHAIASLVRIDLRKMESRLHITIEDDGVGFTDSDDPPWVIASRVAELGGEIALAPNGFARLEITIPNT
jgi:signal transduction histidine kinase